MKIRNLLHNYCSVTIGKSRKLLSPAGQPGDGWEVEDSFEDAVKKYVRLGMVEVVGDEVNVETIAPKPPRMEVKVVDTAANTTREAIVAHCAAAKRDGNPCGTNVSVPVDEYDADKPYFCKRHKNESADDYEKVDGVWHKKALD